jgi:hypothetical protein
LVDVAEALIDLLWSRGMRGSKLARDWRAELVRSHEMVTMRDLIRALGARMSGEKRLELERIARWLEEASFGAPGALDNCPSPADLKRVCRELLASDVSDGARKPGKASLPGETP